MVWKVDDPQGNEAAKVKWEIVPYTRGRVLDLGCGPWKAFPHFTSVDNCHHERFGMSINPDIKSDCDKLDLIASESCDAVFSSHLLEHMVDAKATLEEWWRVIKQDGYLCLYLPHEDLYPKIGENGANPDHKHNLNESKILEWMDEHSWNLLENQKRNEGQEYSFFMVFQKKPEGHAESWKNPKPVKSAGVVRYGAFGDLLQASSVFAGLKKAGFHVTLYTSPPGSDVITNDPNIDQIILQDKDQVPNNELGDFWACLKKKYTRFINLSESVEGTFLALPGRAAHSWPHEVRHKMLNRNYLEFQHELAGVKHDPKVKFFPTELEQAWAENKRKEFGKRVVMWSLAGSSVHKAWPYLDQVMARVLTTFPEMHIILVGGPECVILEGGWENEPRVTRTCGKWSIRQTMSMLEHMDMVIGPETGVLNAASSLNIPKVITLSHSSIENLTRDWVNTVSLEPANKPACSPCHMMHYGWAHCNKHEETGTAMCQANITADQMWEAVCEALLMKKAA